MIGCLSKQYGGVSRLGCPLGQQKVAIITTRPYPPVSREALGAGQTIKLTEYTPKYSTTDIPINKSIQLFPSVLLIAH